MEGSLGGLQVLDLTNDGYIHQRIFSVGQDPFKIERCVLNREKRPSVLFEHLSADIYNMRSRPSSDRLHASSDRVQAFNFIIEKSLKNKLNEQEQSKQVDILDILYKYCPGAFQDTLDILL